MHCTLAGHGPFSFESAATLVQDTYVDIVDDIVPVVVVICVSGLVEDEDDFNLSDLSLSRTADVCTSPRVDFTTTQIRCLELSLAVPDKAGDMFG